MSSMMLPLGSAILAPTLPLSSAAACAVGSANHVTSWARGRRPRHLLVHRHVRGDRDRRRHRAHPPLRHHLPPADRRPVRIEGPALARRRPHRGDGPPPAGARPCHLRGRQSDEPVDVTRRIVGYPEDDAVTLRREDPTVGRPQPNFLQGRAPWSGGIQYAPLPRPLTTCRRPRD